MPKRWRSTVAPLYLLACLLLGGSAQGAWQNTLLQLAGTAILGWAGWSANGDARLSKAARNLLLLGMAAIGYVMVQEVPLPPTFFAHGLRGRILSDYGLLGRPAPWLPVSLTPYESLDSLFALIPPLAIFVAIVRLNAFRFSWLVAALGVGTLAGVVLGAVQVATAPQSLRWYPYPQTNAGSAVGFFANSNHMATLLLLTLPFLAAVAAAAHRQNQQRRSAVMILVAAMALVFIAGIALNRSLAGYTLSVPVIAASTIIVLPRGNSWRRLALAVAGLSLVLAIAALATSSTNPSGKLSQSASTAVQSRAVMLQTTVRAIADTMPLGSGLGSFQRVYRLYESPQTVTSEYVVHAHNDYVELALELGLPGIILMLAFLFWWFRAVRAVWRKGMGDPYSRAASIASAAVLVHSLVDFPLRTAAISACFAMSLGLLVSGRPSRPREPNALRPARHLLFK